MKETMNALVNITICPRSNGTETFCVKCSYKNCGDLCYERLIADSTKVLMRHFTDQHAAETHEQPVETDVINYKVAISDILRELGTPANILGYGYLREAVKLAITNGYDAHDVTKWLYPTVASKFNTTASRVERAIRHAVEMTFERGDYEVIVKYFGNTINANSGKLKNTEVIFGIADYIKLKYSIE